ncbi:putative acyl-CoA-binding protein [Chrysoperla carnea]|uniref:putative acyl-CoA-binding protein n=1 Tax=Chrysoperla carnea TaxID=189513 RepID=UPI001D085642|nr:putative acyl-CoA-binding protein [Chrysoperla carnea]
MSLEDKFKKACQQLRDFTKRPPEADLLELYALYKQANEGDVNKPKPNDAESKKKWDAWSGKKGINKDAAKQAYVNKINSIAGTYT